VGQSLGEQNTLPYFVTLFFMQCVLTVDRELTTWYFAEDPCSDILELLPLEMNKYLSDSIHNLCPTLLNSLRSIIGETKF
jgi:hypothetical protein